MGWKEISRDHSLSEKDILCNSDEINIFEGVMGE